MDYFATIENDLRDAFARDLVRQRRRQRRITGAVVSSGAVAVAVAVAIAATPGGGDEARGPAENGQCAGADDDPAAAADHRRGGPPGDLRGRLVLRLESEHDDDQALDRRVSGRHDGHRAGVPRPRDRERWEAAGRPRLDPVQRDTRTVAAGHAADPSWGDLDALPTDAPTLRTLLERKAGSHDHPTDELLNLSADLLAEPAARPALRAAVFGALAGVDGLQVEEDATDRTGREGVAISLVSANSGARSKTSLIFDRDTTRPLSVETRLLEPVRWVDAAPGTVIDYRTYRYG